MERQTVSNALFPVNPKHGDIFELQPGLLYQYDGGVNSWMRVVSGSVNLPLASTRKAGVMSASDLRKLNRLVLPPPRSTIIGNDCVAPFRRGAIQFYSGDNFVDVRGELDLRNIDEFGDVISEEHAFQIHQHTYGFDFKLNVPRLVQELIQRGQIELQGPVGDKGETGDEGDPGIDRVLSGPAGDQGEQGSAPPCELSLDSEVVPADVRPGLKRALTAVRVVPDESDSMKYSLEFDRQVVGKEDASVSQFNVKQSKSVWVLAVASIAGAPQPVFYLDIEPIIEAVRQKFLDEVNRLKQGYEDIVAFWIQTMSDMFDEQKDALCCALEFCMSKRKSTDLRQHMESVAASAIGANGAKINLHGRNSREAVEIGHTRLFGQRFPDGDDYCKSGPKFPQNPAAGRDDDPEAEAVARSQLDIGGVEPVLVSVDPLLHAGSPQNAVEVELPRGSYSAVIEEFSARIGSSHNGAIRLQYVADGMRRTAQFLDKGSFGSLMGAKEAYEGLAVGFTHDGGNVRLYFPIAPTMDVSGKVVVRIEPQKEAIQPVVQQQAAVDGEAFVCAMSLSHLAWYKKGWDVGRCCGLVVNVAGQDYIIFKRSIGDDDSCGGGESLSTPCVAAAVERFGELPAFAWPTLDGETFSPLPASESIEFMHDPGLQEVVLQKIAASEYRNPKGNPAGRRHLSYQMSVVLFPCA